MRGRIIYSPGTQRKLTMHTLGCVRPTLQPGWSVLDVGCGSGHVLAELASDHGVMGLDIVDCRETDLPEFQLYDGVHLPCADASHDVVLLTFVLHHVPNERKPALVSEARRVARRHVLVLEDTPRTFLDRWVCAAHGRAFRRKIGSSAAFGFYGQRQWESFFAAQGMRVARSVALPRFERDWKRPWARSLFVLERAR
jgi:ubiquinone/menaquinone biosynthesis C-methylase UbiE